jgi:hypothetical protein
LTIKSTSHTKIAHTCQPILAPAFRAMNATSSRFTLLVFVMPVNIQLSKISIASAIS